MEVGWLQRLRTAVRRPPDRTLSLAPAAATRVTAAIVALPASVGLKHLSTHVLKAGTQLGLRLRSVRGT